MTKLWISSSIATGQVDATDGVITEAPPIWRKFVGQPVDNILTWLRRLNVRIEEL